MVRRAGHVLQCGRIRAPSVENIFCDDGRVPVIKRFVRQAAFKSSSNGDRTSKTKEIKTLERGSGILSDDIATAIWNMLGFNRKILPAYSMGPTIK